MTQCLVRYSAMREVETMSGHQTLHEFLMEYWERFMHGFSIKAIIAAGLTAFTEYTGGHHVVLLLYLLFTTLDLLLGMSAAVIYKQFCGKKLNRWLRKVCTQLFVVVLFAALLKMLFYTASVELTLTNWLLFIFSIMDFASVMDKLVYLGAPVPPVVQLMVGSVRKRVAHKVSELLHDEELEHHIEKALEGRNERPLLDADSSRRSAGVDVDAHAESEQRDNRIDNQVGHR